jgi:bifunctional DNase/RNase
MALRKVGDYAVIGRGGEGCPDPGCPFSQKQYALRLHLDGGTGLDMYSIPPHIAEALKQTGDDTGDLFHVLREASGRGLDPYNAVKAIRINTNYDNSGCNLNKILGISGKKLYGRDAEVASCPDSDFRENAASSAVLGDGSALRLRDPRHAVYIGAVYGCDIGFNGRAVQDFMCGDALCNVSPMVVLELKDAGKTPVFVGFESGEAPFLARYNYRERRHLLDVEEPPTGYRLAADEFVHVARRDGHRLGRVEINSMDERGVYKADAVTGNDARLPMIPSNAFLLSRCLGVDAFVEERLVRQQEGARRM